MGVELPSYRNVAISIKAFDELLALVTEVRLCGEVGWGAFFCGLRGCVSFDVSVQRRVGFLKGRRGGRIMEFKIGVG